ncbi:MAG: hypothetical protein WHT09_03745 [Thermogutta sp.]
MAERGGLRARLFDPAVSGGDRLEELHLLQGQIAAWSADLNARQRGVDWQMTAEDVRCKLKSLYPKTTL